MVQRNGSLGVSAAGQAREKDTDMGPVAGPAGRTGGNRLMSVGLVGSRRLSHRRSLVKRVARPRWQNLMGAYILVGTLWETRTMRAGARMRR